MLTSLLVAAKLFLFKIILALKTTFPVNFALTTPFSADPGRVGILRRSVGLSSAQILGLDGAPVTIVPAPGAGFMIVPILIVIQFVGGTVAYLNGSTGVTSFSIGSVLNQAVGGSEAIWLVTVAPNRRTQTLLWLTKTGTAANPPAEDNQPLTLGGATANFTAGTGVAQVTAYYTVEPTT